MLDCITLDASNIIICRPTSRQNSRLEEEMDVIRHLTITYVLVVAASNFPLTTHYILHSSVSLMFTLCHISQLRALQLFGLYEHIF